MSASVSNIPHAAPSVSARDHADARWLLVSVAFVWISTAVLVALKNRMDLSIGVAIGSSIQIALFVAPVLVFASYFLCPQPMNLVFTPAEVLAIALAVIITGEIAGDGESNWLEGVQLLSVYIILALVFYFMPDTAPAAAH